MSVCDFSTLPLKEEKKVELFRAQMAGNSVAIVLKANVKLAAARGFVFLDSSLTTAAVQGFND